MKQQTKIFQIEFAESIPRPIEQGVLYISMKYSTSIHLCACGCGYEVVTKLSPDRWRLLYDGDSITLYPSVGNFSLPCRSHYWIIKNTVDWAEPWSDQKIIIERKKFKELKG